MMEHHQMSTIETPTLIKVNDVACRRVAEWIASHAIPRDAEEASLGDFTDIEVGDFYLFLVSICHQTSPIGHPPLMGSVSGQVRRGWDYLLTRFLELARYDRRLIDPANWIEMSGETIASFFRDSEYGLRLIEIDRRAQLVRNLGEVMRFRRWRHLQDLFVQARGRIEIGKPNLIGLLSEFEAFRDPVNKKTFFLLALMKNHAIWRYADPDRLGPPVDYHEIRGHLRLGTVEITCPELLAKLLSRECVEEHEDLAIREAVLRAIMKISEMSGLRDPAQLHYLFWNIFRSCCQRNETHCERCPPTCSLPARYISLAIQDAVRGCPFRTVCQGAQDPAKRRLIEQSVSIEYDYH